MKVGMIYMRIKTCALEMIGSQSGTFSAEMRHSVSLMYLHYVIRGGKY